MTSTLNDFSPLSHNLGSDFHAQAERSHRDHCSVSPPNFGSSPPVSPQFHSFNYAYPANPAFQSSSIDSSHCNVSDFHESAHVAPSHTLSQRADCNSWDPQPSIPSVNASLSMLSSSPLSQPSPSSLNHVSDPSIRPQASHYLLPALSDDPEYATELADGPPAELPPPVPPKDSGRNSAQPPATSELGHSASPYEPRATVSEPGHSKYPTMYAQSYPSASHYRPVSTWAQPTSEYPPFLIPNTRNSYPDGGFHLPLPHPPTLPPRLGRNKLRKPPPAPRMPTASRAPTEPANNVSGGRRMVDNITHSPLLLGKDRVPRSMSYIGHGAPSGSAAGPALRTRPSPSAEGSTSTSVSTTCCTSGSGYSHQSTPATTPGSQPHSRILHPSLVYTAQSNISHDETMQSFRAVPAEIARPPLVHMQNYPSPATSSGPRKLKKRPPPAPSSRSNTLPTTTAEGHSRGMLRSRSLLMLGFWSQKNGSSSDSRDDKQRPTSMVYGSGDPGNMLPRMRQEQPFRMGIPLNFRPPTFDPIVSPTSMYSSQSESSHDHSRNTSQAMSDFAWTGLSSSALAELTSRFSFCGSPERKDGPPHAHPDSVVFSDNGSTTFDPYAEPSHLLPSPLSENSHTGNDTGQALSHSHTRSTSLSFLRTEPVLGGRRRGRNGSPASMRRWTLAMADVSDDTLVEELERMRKDGTARGRRRRDSHARSQTGSRAVSGVRAEEHSFVYGGPGAQIPQQQDGSVAARSGARFHVGADSAHNSDDEGESGDEEDGEDGTIAEADEAGWRAARKALLCCRDLVRTERNYQALLRQLISGETTTPPPSLMLSYLPALLSASESLLTRLVDDPSAWGVSVAFIGCEEELETALVAWCGIVGEFFQDGESGREKGARMFTRKATEETKSAVGHGDRDRPSVGLRSSIIRSRSKSGVALQAAGSEGTQRYRVSSYIEELGARGSGMFTAALGTGLGFGLSPPVEKPDPIKALSSSHVGRSNGFTRTVSTWRRKSMSASMSNIPAATIPLNSAEQRAAKSGHERKRSVRDLAIQPTQRVTRYVLQFKDLLAHTPTTSPSRGLVERALDSAMRIAQKCDRAQGNYAFLRRP